MLPEAKPQLAPKPNCQCIASTLKIDSNLATAIKPSELKADKNMIKAKKVVTPDPSRIPQVENRTC